MPNFIQPWDKEYWSKGARKRLFDEYSAGQVEEDKQRAENIAQAQLKTRLKEMEQGNVYDIGRDAAERTFRTGERVGGQEFTRGQSDISAQRAANEAERQSAHDIMMAQTANENRRSEQDRAAQIAEQSAIAARTRAEARAKNYQVGEALKAVQADNPNLAPAEAQTQAETLAEESLNAVAGAGMQGEVSKARLLQQHPEFGFPGVYSAISRGDEKAAELQQTADMIRALAPDLYKKLYPNSSAPVGPTRSTGLGPMPAMSTGGGRVSDSEGEQRRRISLGPPKSNIQKYRERYRLGE